MSLYIAKDANNGQATGKLHLYYGRPYKEKIGKFYYGQDYIPISRKHAKLLLGDRPIPKYEDGAIKV